MANGSAFAMLADPLWSQALQSLTVPASPLQQLAWNISREGAYGILPSLYDYIAALFRESGGLRKRTEELEGEVTPIFRQLLESQIQPPQLTKPIEELEGAMERMLQTNLRQVTERLGDRLSRSGAFANIASEALKDLVAQTAFRKAEMQTQAMQQQFANLLDLAKQRAGLAQTYAGLASELAKGKAGAGLLPYETQYRLYSPFLDVLTSEGLRQYAAAESGLQRALDAWRTGKYWTTQFPFEAYSRLLGIILGAEEPPKYVANEYQQLLQGLMNLNLLQSVLSTPASSGASQPKR